MITFPKYFIKGLIHLCFILMTAPLWMPIIIAMLSGYENQKASRIIDYIFET